MRFILGKVGLFYINQRKRKGEGRKTLTYLLSFVNWNGSEIVGVYVLVLNIPELPILHC